MRKALLMFFLACSSAVYATTYYVAPSGGSDINPGTIDRPWATWQKAFNTAHAGDTVYFRGGVWYLQPGQTVNLINKDGAPGKYIHFFNYPGEKPVLDGSRIVPQMPASGQNSYSGGPYIDGSNYIHWRGLTIRNFYQVYERVFVQGIVATNSNFQIFENITVHNIGGRGIYYVPWYAPDTTYFINVDVHHCADSLPLNDVLGGWADGWNAGVEKGSYMVFDGCRAWSNSDDGFNIWGAGLIVMKNCWSFGNGLLEGDGSGFKLNPTIDLAYMGLTRVLTNNLAAFNTGNTGCGFNENNIGSVSMEGRIYNNTSYNNIIGYMTGGWLSGPQKNNDYRNNISYLNTLTNVDENEWSGGNFNTDLNNTWTEGVTFQATKDDFVLTDKSLAIAELTAARKLDGSLPDISFLKLVKGSDLIDKGVNVGLPFSGLAPDIGAFEYGAENTDIKKVTSIVVAANGGIAAITTDNGTLQLSATVLPSDATNKTVTWAISSGTDKARISSTGLVTALDNGTAVARATATDGSGVYGTLTITISNQVNPVTGITVTGAGGVSAISTDNGTLQLSATVLPANATNKTVIWTLSGGTDKASISSKGLVTALDNGTAIARATANDGSGVYGTLTITISNQTISVTGIAVTGTGGVSTIISDNGTLQLSAAATPLNATNKTVTWSISSGTDKARISSTGLLTALDNGTAIAKATANDGSGVYGTLSISISNQIIPVTGITVAGAGGSLLITVIGGTLQLTAAILPSNATNKTVTWSISSGTDKASISSTGIVTALDNGTAIARATANDGSGVYGTLTITISNQIVPVTGIAVSGSGGVSTISTDNGTLQLNTAITPSNATNKTVTWSMSSGTDKATISSSGLVTALDNGTGTARATANDGSGIFGTLTITISNQLTPVSGITVIGAGGISGISTDNGTLQLTAVVMPADANNKTVTWSISSGTDKARISSSGLVTALDNGTATARATANDGSEVYGSFTISISGQIVPVTGVTVTGAGGLNSIILHAGTLQLNASVVPSNATNKTVTWSISSGLDKARISSTGLVTALDNGTAIARATANDGSAIYGALMITISNQVKVTNAPPIVVANYQTNSYSGFVGEIDASKSYDSDGDNLIYSWIIPGNIPVSSDNGPVIRYLGPLVDSPQTYEFILNISDGKTSQTKVIPIQIIPYQPELEVAEISGIEASSFQSPNNPYNIIDGNIGTMWSAEGDAQWVILELKHSFSIHHLKLAFQPGQKTESYFDILGSVDKILWEPILTKSSSCVFSGDIQVFDFPPSKTAKEYKYLKLIGLGNSSDKWNYISELKVFGLMYRSSREYEDLPVKVYPNPASEYVRIRIDDQMMFPDLLEITTGSGMLLIKEILDPDIREYSIPFNLKQGHYILTLRSGALALFTQKFLVNK